MDNASIPKFVGMGAVVLVAATIVFGSFYTIDQGDRGVILCNGAICGEADAGLHWHLTFDPAEDIAAPFIGGAKPKMAILREQGVNSQVEMSYAMAKAGFDTFSGLPPDDQFHPRWEAGSFATNYLHGHPSLAFGEPITPDSIRALFARCGLPTPELEVGLFSDTLPKTIHAKYQRAALVHIDSDLYPSAREVLFGIEPILQDGTMLCFDDWFMYRGAPDKGEQRAFSEFLAAHPRWQAIPYQTYSVFCNSFILHRRNE